MEDRQIVQLFWQRQETAIAETQKKYGRWFFQTARNILGDDRDAEEAVSDALAQAWARIPPAEPLYLGAFVSKLVRSRALDALRKQSSEKRGGAQGALCLEELADCLPAGNDVEHSSDSRQLAAVLNGFVRSLEADKRAVFVLRYFHGMPVQSIARRFGYSETKTSNMLARLRKQLRERLEKEEWL